MAAFTAGTTINSSDVNSDFSDIASALTDSLSVSGKGGMSASLQGAAGTLVNPGYTFLSDTKTGFWLSGTHQIQFSHNGVAGLTLNSDTSANFPAAVSITGALTVSGGISGAIPAGVYMPYGGSAAPTGWLLCYGQAISRTTYAALFTAISTLWGVGDGSTTFNVPDLRGRVPIGLDNMGGVDAGRIDWANTIGTTGGEQYHTLAKAELPSYNLTVTDPGHSHVYADPVNTGFASTSGGLGTLVNIGSTSTNSATTGITVNSGGSGTPHNVMQPGFVTNWIIKT